MTDPRTTARWLIDWVERGTWRDLPGVLLPSDPAPKPERYHDVAVLGDMWVLEAEERLQESARELGVRVYDFRGMNRLEHYPTKTWGWFRDDEPKRNIPKRGRARGRRKWKNVTAIMLHRTAVEEMRPHRFLGTPCHGAVANDASIVLCHPHDAYVMHGHNSNKFSVGIELADADGELDEMQVAASLILVRYVYEDLLAHRDRDVVVMAHRQSRDDRTEDCGWRIFQQVGVPAMNELGMRLGPVVGSGTELPEKWLLGLDPDTTPITIS